MSDLKLASNSIGSFNFVADNYSIPSNILTGKDKLMLKQILHKEHLRNWKLLYRASSDGFYSSDFHRKEDSFNCNLAIFETENGNFFGGYSSKNWRLEQHHSNNSWNSSRHYSNQNNIDQNKNDPEAFIFSIKNDAK